jgi:D-3-phosphoglycerate dehydrogenase
VLATDPNIGYLVMDLEQDVAASVGDALGELSASIRTRVLQ